MKKQLIFLLITVYLISVLGSIPTQTVRAATLVVTNTNDSGSGSLRQTVIDATSGDTITFDLFLSGETIHLQSTLTIDKNITIDASSLTEKLILSGDSDNDGDGDILILNILANQTVVIKNLEFTKGYTPNSTNAGAIANLGDLSVYDSEFHFNVGGQGGAIRNSGLLHVENSIFTNNTGIEGGAILNNINAQAEIRNSTFSNNIANEINNLGGAGGAIASVGTISIYDSEFTNNSAAGGGGAVVNAFEGIAIISNNTFIGNSASEDGGGAINNFGGTVNIAQSTFTNNSANYGGAIIAGDHPNGPDTTTTISESVISNNQATVGGGGVEFDSGTSMTIDKTTISGNTALAGGGVVNVSGNLLTITNSTIATNTSTQSPQPGGVLSLHSPVTIKNSTVTGNNHTAVGIQGHAIISNTTIAGNSGYGLEVFTYSLTITNSILANNGSFDCRTQWEATVATNQNNLIETNSGCGTPASTADPLLGPLADNGGLTQTMSLLSGSPAIDAGNNATCETNDQRNVSRPQGTTCDMGAFEYQDFVPVVESINRANPSPTGAESISFSIIFSESVTNVDINDFSLTTTGVTGAIINGISGTGSTYTVIVNTGSGSGTIKLNLIDDDSIIDNTSKPLGGTGSGNGTFNSGEIYTITKTTTLLPAPKISRTMFRFLTNHSTPTFEWSSVNQAFGYEIMIATDKSFTNIILNENSSTTSFTPSTPLTDGIYYWRVSALNEISQAGKYSQIQTLTIDTTAPVVPTLTSPMDGAVLKRSPVLRWTRVTGGVIYELQVDDNNIFSSPTTFTLRTNSRNLPALPDGVYYWRVRVKDLAGNWSDWSTIREFEIDR